MEPRIPHTSVWGRILRAILAVSCVGLFPALTTAQAKMAPVPLTAASGAAAAAGSFQNQALTEAIYLPYITAVPTPVVDTGRGSGAVYYVAETGNDAHPGTMAQPWKTLHRSVSALQAGDTLYIRSGAYRLSEPLTVTASGNTSQGQITISTLPGDPSLAVISGDTNGDGSADAPSTSAHLALIELRGSYLHLENLEVTASKGRGIRSKGANNVISYNNVHHIWGNGIYAAGPDTVIEANTVWRTSDINYCGGTQQRRCNGSWSGAIAWGTTDSSSAPGVAPRNIVRGNTVFNNSGEGVLCMHTDGGLVEGNILYDNWGSNVDLDQCSYTTIQQNLIYATLDTSWWKHPNRPTTGILISNEGIRDENGRTYPIGHNRKLINNILSGTGAAFSFWSGSFYGGRQPGSAYVNDIIAHNTIVNTQSPDSMGFYIEIGPHANTRIVNNIIYETMHTVAWAEGSTAGITFENNLWSEVPPAGMSSAADVIGDPRLADPGRLLEAGKAQAEWYLLRSASPAINRGAVLPDVTHDFWGVQRPAHQVDIGADEY